MKKKREREPDDEEEISFAVNKDELDTEWVSQPDLAHFWSKELADARLELEEKKAALEVTKAELDRDVRANPKEFGIEKITESAVGAAIVLDPAHGKALARVNNAKHKVDICSAAVTAVSHKKAALENLVYLHGASYFSTPRARGEDGEAMEEVAKTKVRRMANRGLQRNREDDDE